MAFRQGLVGIVSGLIIGAAIFIYVSSILLQQLKIAYRSGTTAAQQATFNTSVDNLITMSFTIGTLMAVAAIAVVGFWIVKSVIGGT